MRNYLIHFLGGLTAEDLESLHEQVNSWRERAMNFQNQTENLEKDLSYTRGKVDQLIEMLFKSKSQETPITLSGDEPIPTLPLPWSRMKGNLERLDREGKLNAKVPGRQA